MGIPEGFTPFEPQGPYLEHVGPILERDGAFGLLVEERHTNHRGTIPGRPSRFAPSIPTSAT